MTQSEHLNIHAKRTSVRKKLFASVALGAFALGVALLAVLPSLIDRSNLKSRMLAELAVVGHTQFEASGPLEYATFPTPALTLNSVKTTDSTGALVFAADKLTAHVSLLSLLSGTIKIDRVAVSKGNIVWDMRQAISTGTTTGNSQLIPLLAYIGSGSGTSRVEAFDCRQCNISVVRSDGTPQSVADLTGRIEWPNPNGKATLKAAFDWNGETVGVDSQIASPLQLTQGTESAVRFSAKSSLASFSFDGLANVSGQLFTEGLIKFQATSLKRFLDWSEPGETAGSSIGSLDLEAKLTGKDGKLQFQEMALGMSGAAANGTFEVDLLTSPPKTSGTLAFGSVDLAALVSALPLGAGGDSDLTLLDTINLDLRLSAQSASIGTHSIANAAGAIRIQDGLADIDLGTGDYGGGTLMGRLAISGAKGNRQGKLSISIRDVQGEKLAEAETGAPVIAAPLSAKIDLEGPYVGLENLMTNGSGTLVLEAGKGVIRNFNMDSFAGLLAAGGSFDVTESYAGLSDVQSALMEARIRKGMVLVDKGQMLIGGYNLSFAGALPFHSRGLAINGALTGNVADESPAGFFVGGTWDRPVVTTGPVNP